MTALGGFTGADPILTTERLAALMGDGTVRFFLLLQQIDQTGSAPPGAPAGFTISSPVTPLATWISEHCAAVQTELWQSASDCAQIAPVPGLTSGGAQRLFRCAGQAPGR